MINWSRVDYFHEEDPGFSSFSKSIGVISDSNSLRLIITRFESGREWVVR